MRIYQLDPTKDRRWSELLERHPDASVFHTAEWLRALRGTYGYEPVAFTTSSPACELKNGIVFCSISSWLTGRRLVSLPFSDHCEPLCESAEDSAFLIRYLQTALEHQQLKYLELRPTNSALLETEALKGLQPSARYFLHVLDLRPSLEEVFQRFDRDSVQRRIRRAERSGLNERCGRSEKLLRDFYSLFIHTRGRHHLPPMPFSWFQNLIHCQGPALEIRAAYQDETPVSAILTLRFRDTVCYKYGCSAWRFNKFGATPWLLWNAMVAAKSGGATKFDLGRTEEDNLGLLDFKNHWVRQPTPLVYWRFPAVSSFDSLNGWKLKMAKRIFSYMPNRLLTLTGKMIYRHIG